MKKLFTIVAGVILVNLSAFAQGTILLQNLWTGGSAPIRDVNGTLIPAGASQFTVELWGAPTSAGPLVALPATTTTWLGGGVFGLGGSPKVLPGLAGGSTPFFAVKIWDATGGLTYDQAIAAGRQYGYSTLPVGAGGAGGGWTLGAPLGDPNAVPTPTPPPGLVGMQSFRLTQIPEPSTIALAILGAGALLLRRRK